MKKHVNANALHFAVIKYVIVKQIICYAVIRMSSVWLVYIIEFSASLHFYGLLDSWKRDKLFVSYFESLFFLIVCLC